MLFYYEGRLHSTQVHAERAKLHTVNDPYSLGKTMMLQAKILCQRHKLEEVRSEALRAADIFEKLGVSLGAEACGVLLEDIQKTRDRLVASVKLREFLHTMPFSGVLVSNLWLRNRMEALTTASNSRDATSWYPVLTPSNTASFHTTADHLCSSFCSLSLLTPVHLRCPAAHRWR